MKKVLDHTSFIGGDLFVDANFLLRNLFRFWILCILFWMGIFLAMDLIFRRSEAFEAAKQYCQNSGDITLKTGEIMYYGALVSGNIAAGGQDGEGGLSFTIVGKNGNYYAYAKAHKTIRFLEGRQPGPPVTYSAAAGGGIPPLETCSIRPDYPDYIS
ncbi:MAG: hypothetical protein EOP49_04060, partial [Sphingobacteriales bacterium]